jgi:hypothetical protein
MSVSESTRRKGGSARSRSRPRFRGRDERERIDPGAGEIRSLTLAATGSTWIRQLRPVAERRFLIGFTSPVFDPS